MRLCLLGDELLVDVDSIVGIFPAEEGGCYIDLSMDNHYLSTWSFEQVRATLEVFHL